jgi:cation diffusion facilitator CzcD-associated flavoprotein CzcO
VSWDADVAVLGAGPYGLSVAAHLRDAGLETRVFGRPLVFWRENMPIGMFLRSSARASNIADPHRRYTLSDYASSERRELPKPVPLEEFVRYADWFREALVPEVDEREVQRVERDGMGFSLDLDDGAVLTVPRLVVAAGIAPFARRPAAFAELPASRVTHSVELRDPAGLRDKRVAVVGAGQSALESAALLRESGSVVEVIARARQVVWIPPHSPARTRPDRVARRLMYPPTEVGPRGVNWIAAAPDVFRRLPTSVQRETDRLCMRPMGAAWLRSRMAQTPITLGRTVVSAATADGHVRLLLDDGQVREVDHVVVGTGFEVDISRYGFLAPDIHRDLEMDGGYPRLGTGLESSIARLHFLGAPAARTFGPVMRFVTGTSYAAPALTCAVTGRRSPPVRFSF